MGLWVLEDILNHHVTNHRATNKSLSRAVLWTGAKGLLCASGEWIFISSEWLGEVLIDEDFMAIYWCTFLHCLPLHPAPSPPPKKKEN